MSGSSSPSSGEYHFYKAVKDAHIRGVEMFNPNPGPGIKTGGLDPHKRNAAGGATMLAMAQSGREMSDADRSGFGQCLAGDESYGIDYCTQSDHVLLRITLTDAFRKSLVKSSRTDGLNENGDNMFATMQAAVDASECTAIARIEPGCIEYRAKKGWKPISAYFKNDAKDFTESSDEDDDD